jgi:Electron transfer DM13
MIHSPTRIGLGTRLALRAGVAVIALSIIVYTGVAPTEVSAQSAQPVLLASGQFGGVDSFHKGEGKARLFRLSDGTLVLRLEEFKVTNGPDLYVFLSGHPAPRNGAQVHEGAALEVARLKGNIGNQNYALPPNVDLSKFKSVVIYCKQFSVVFSTAELSRS